VSRTRTKRHPGAAVMRPRPHGSDGSPSNPIGCAGALAKAALQGAHARLAHRGIWALNEKRMASTARRAGLARSDFPPLYGRQTAEAAVCSGHCDVPMLGCVVLIGSARR
jgi:hypothetical protein